MNCMGGGERIHVLIGMSSWTKKREVMHVSRLKGWYSVNKISSRSNRQSIHITVKKVHNFSCFLRAAKVGMLRVLSRVG